MFQPEDNVNSDRNPDIDKEENLDNIDANISPKNVAQRKQQLQKMFTKLIIFGLAFGAVLGVGAYYLINWLGLNKKPYELEIEQEQEQIAPPTQQSTLFNQVGSYPKIPQGE